MIWYLRETSGVERLMGVSEVLVEPTRMALLVSSAVIVVPLASALAPPPGAFSSSPLPAFGVGTDCVAERVEPPSWMMVLPGFELPLDRLFH